MWRLWILCVFFLVLLVLWVWCVCVGASFCSFVVSESLLHYHDEAVMVAATLLIQKTTRGVSFRSPTRTKIDMFCLRHFSRFSCHALFARDSDCFLASQNMLENDLTFEFYDGHACQTKNNHANLVEKKMFFHQILCVTADCLIFACAKRDWNRPLTWIVDDECFSPRAMIYATILFKLVRRLRKVKLLWVRIILVVTPKSKSQSPQQGTGTTTATAVAIFTALGHLDS